MASVISAIAVLTGTIVGSGILAIPYVAAKAGLWTGIFMIVALGIMMLMVNLMLGEVMLKSRKAHQLTGYAERYFGRRGKLLMAISVFVGIFGALSAQIIGEGEAIKAVLGGNAMLWAVVFYAIMSFLICQSMKIFEKAEVSLGIVKLSLFAVILAILFFSPDFSIKHQTFQPAQIMLPFGVVLFALLGTAAIPEVRRELDHKTKKILFVLIAGSIIPMILYILFTLAVVGVTKSATTDVATVGLANIFGASGILMNLFAVLTMSTAYLGLSFAVKNMLKVDYKLKEDTAILITILTPALILTVSKSFIKLIGIAGAIGGGIAGILIILMHDKTDDRQPEYHMRIPGFVKYIFIGVFIVGAIASLFY